MKRPVDTIVCPVLKIRNGKGRVIKTEPIGPGQLIAVAPEYSVLREPLFPNPLNLKKPEARWISDDKGIIHVDKPLPEGLF